MAATGGNRTQDPSRDDGLRSHVFDAGSRTGLKPVLDTLQAALASPAAQVPAVFKPVLDTWQAVLAGSSNGQASRPATRH